MFVFVFELGFGFGFGFAVALCSGFWSALFWALFLTTLECSGLEPMFGKSIN